MSHECHAIECGKPVAPRLLFCRKHWSMLPKDHQKAIWDNYRPGQEVDKRPSHLYVLAQTLAVVEVGMREGRKGKATEFLARRAIMLWQRGDPAIRELVRPLLEKLRLKLNELAPKESVPAIGEWW